MMTPNPTHLGTVADLAAQVLSGLVEAGWTVATAESITGGLVCAALTDVSGASAAVRGGVVSYATDAKHSLLGVDADLLARRGAVDADVAAQMARGVARLLAVDCAVATTGSAGPDDAPGGSQSPPVSPGTVFIAVHSPHRTWVEQVMLSGDREQIRAAAVATALHALVRALPR